MVCAGVLLWSIPRAHAGIVTLTDGSSDPGHVATIPDDYGAYGIQLPSSGDGYVPPGLTTSQVFAITYITGGFLKLTTPGNLTTRVVLTDNSKWWGLLEAPPSPDGIAGDHAGLTRTVTTGIAVDSTGLEATSAFRIAHAGSGLQLDFDLVQTLVPKADLTGDFHQVYTVHNTGTTPVDIVFHVSWEADLYFSDTQSYMNDVVGVSPDFCAVYMHDPGSSMFGVALGDGGSTVPMSYYYGGKEDVIPDPSGPPMLPLSAMMPADQHVWNAGGVPATWRNYVAGAGYDTAGDSGSLDADATIGREWTFSIDPGATEVVHVLRRYGSVAIPCPPALATCGNGVLDTGELCDGADTSTCNGATCAASLCGDGYINEPAGEECESSGVDSDTCNGASCTAVACGDGYVNAAAGEQCDDGDETASCNLDCTPAACGDGHVNLAAGEECETGSLCDVATCRVTFSLGGGCAGCGSGGDPSGTLSLGVGLFVVSVRRRRRRARAR